MVKITKDGLPSIKVDKGPFKHEPDSILAATPKEAAAIYRNLKEQEKPMPDEVDKLLEKYPQLGAIMRDANATPFKKRLAVMPILKDIQGKIEADQKIVATLEEKQQWAERLLQSVEGYKEWKLLPPKLEKNDCSRLHQLIAFLKQQYKHIPEHMVGQNPHEFPWHEVTPFVVEHDWASAFKNATEYAEGMFNLPYEKCAFEFRISGWSVTVLAQQDDKDHEPAYLFHVGRGDFWASEDDERPPAYAFALEQIKAICVALDAEVATRNVVRVSEKVNRKRVAEGREPFFSYHVVNLSRRYRIGNPSGGGGVVQGKRRLHFRRGHWRHFANFKTWVRWTLVGNPELGFIDKEYRL